MSSTSAAPPQHVQRVEMLSAQDAADFYARRCQALGQNCNPTFLKQLISDTVVFEFDNGYLGNNGILPIMETLQRVPIQELLLPTCALTTGDYIVICDAFATHPTLQHIDLRGNVVEVTSAKKILMLIGRNTGITELDLDERTPKYAAIQQQLARNRNEPFTLDKCLVCGKPVRYVSGGDTERKVLSALIDLYSPMQYAVSAVEFEAVFRLLQRCCEQGRGLLFLCSGSCLGDLANMIYAGARCVLKACHFHVDYVLPKLQILYAQTQRLIDDVASRNLDAAHFEAPHTAGIATAHQAGTSTTARSSSSSSPAAAVAAASVKRGAAADTYSETDDITAYFDDRIDGPAGVSCSVCGKEAATLTVGPSLLLEHLAKDVCGGAPLGPSTLLRLVRVFVEHCDVRPCSRKCTKQIERYALLGFGGVVRRQPAGSVPLLSSIGIAMESTTTDFTVIDFGRETVDSVDEEETVCARAVASVVGDIDNATGGVDPYLIFAVARKLRNQTPSTLGAQLQASCEAVCLIGCLQGDERPFRSSPRPARAAYSSWDNWSAQAEAADGPGTVAARLRTAFSHRRSGFFQVDGPHQTSIFDNVRTALWSFRRQRRAVLTVMKFAVRWLALKDGVVPDTVPPKGGFYTAVKVVGQCVVENEFRLIVQGFFGPLAGHEGYFYLSKYMFNISVKEGAYMFVDGAALYATEAAPVSLTETLDDARVPAGSAAARPGAVEAVGVARHCERLVSLVVQYLHQRASLSAAQVAPLQAVLRSLPLSATALGDAEDAKTLLNASSVLGLVRRCIVHRLLPSQLLFALSEQLGADGVAWMLQQRASESSLRTVVGAVPRLETQSARAQQETQAAHTANAPLSHGVPLIDWKVSAGDLDESMTATSEPADAVVEVVRQSQASNVARRTGGGAKNQRRTPNPPSAPSRTRDSSSRNAASAGAAGRGSNTDKSRSKSPGRQRSPGSRPPSSSGRDEGGLRGAAKDIKADDPRQQALAQLWAIERLQQLPHYTHDNSLPYNAASPMHSRMAASSRSGSQDTAACEDVVESSLLNQRWTAMRLCKALPQSAGVTDSVTVFSALHVCIIGDTFTVYDAQTQRTVLPKCALAEHPLLRAFPFPSGCDALVHHPLRSREVFVFAGAFWAVWDACEQVIIAGPFALAAHEQFRALPREFLTGVDGAIPVFGTSLLLLFKAERFVLFDLVKAAPVTEVRHLHSAPPEPPLRSARANGVSATTASTSASHKAAEAAAAAKLPVLILDTQVAEQLGTAPFAALPDVSQSSASPSGVAQVITASGRVVTVTFRPTQSTSGAAQPPVRPAVQGEPLTLTQSVYRSLPLCFQQCTLRGAGAICDALLQNMVDTHPDVAAASFFDPQALLRQITERDLTLRGGANYNQHTTSPQTSGGAAPVASGEDGDDADDRDQTKPHTTTATLLDVDEEKDGSSWRPSLQLFTPLSDIPAAGNALLTSAAFLRAGPSTSNGSESSHAGSIELDLGSLCEEAFGGVMLVLDTTRLGADVLRLAPIRAVVESSLDDASLVYQQRGVLSASTAVSHASWPECHVARHWRVRFVTPLPTGIGVVRVLWLRTQWRPSEAPVQVLRRLELTRDSLRVDIDAAQVLVDLPETLLTGATTGVFEVSDTPWFAPHTVLPLFTTTTTTTRGTGAARDLAQPCLVFCGDHFAEVDLTTGAVAGRRACSIRTHPAFAALPGQFRCGFDAVFYPPRQSCGDVVVLVRRGWQLHWNLRLGQPEGQMVRCTEGYFRGLPVDLAQVYSVCNVWETSCAEADQGDAAPLPTTAVVRSSSLWIVLRVRRHAQTETHVLQWSLSNQRIERGPCAVCEWPELRHQSLVNAPLQCVFTTPIGDTHVLSNSLYYCYHAATAMPAGTSRPADARGEDCGLTLRGPIQQDARWYQLAWHLPRFATPQTHTHVTLDFLSCTHAILGLSLTSSHADNRAWDIAYSDDRLTWHTLPIRHCQRAHAPAAQTVWQPSHIQHCSHRYWRLSTDSSCEATRDGTPKGPCLYSGLTLLVLPVTQHYGRPERVSLSATSVVPLETLLRSPAMPFTLAFEAGSEVASFVSASHRVNSPSLPTRTHHLTLDYGASSPVFLTGFSCEVSHGTAVSSANTTTTTTWAVLCADDDRDPANWDVCTIQRMVHAAVHAEWVPSRPRRYWRIELCCDRDDDKPLRNLLARHWALHRYDGPVLTPRSTVAAGGDGAGMATGSNPPLALLFAAPPSRPACTVPLLRTGVTPLALPCRSGTALDIQMPLGASPLALVGFDLVCTSATCQRARFQLQRSQDGLVWTEVAQAQWQRDAPLTVCRGSGGVGAAPLWRILLVHAEDDGDDDGWLQYHCLRLVKATPHLYTNFHTLSDPPPLSAPLATSLTQAPLPETAAAVASNTSTLTLRSPQVMCQVRATLPPCSVYQVERLSLDGVTWDAVIVLENCNVTQCKRVRRGWSSLVPSTGWRLRSLTAPVVNTSAVLAPGGSISGSFPYQSTLTDEVCWSSFACVVPTRVDLRHLPGLVMKSTGFTEIEPIRELCADAGNGPLRPRAVLRCAVDEHPLLRDPLIVWQFASHIALYQVTAVVHVAIAPAVPPTAATTHEDEDVVVPVVVVESSANGIDYVCVAEAPLLSSASPAASAANASQKHIFPVSLSWDPSNASAVAIEQLFWRVRFHDVPPHCTLDVVRAEWFTLQGAAVAASSSLAPRTPLSATSTAFVRWKHEAFNQEAAFCRQCRLGLDEAKSLESKLRESDDSSRAGETALGVLAKSKRFNKFIVKLAKNTSPGIPLLPDSPLLASGAERFRDLQYFLKQCGLAYPDSRFDDLVPLVGQPLPLRDLVYSKKASAWFYPRFAVHGSVSEPFYGIARTQACFAVLWSLSFDLQRNQDLVSHPAVNDISPHVASPLVAVNITHSDWQAAKSFPDLPLLYHVGFSACPLTIVFAPNEVPFTEEFNLPLPDAKPLATAFPFSVYPGVNFIRRMPIAACPAPVFDHLRLLFPPAFLETEQVVVVFTVPSLQSRTAKVRFTLPAGGIDLGLPRLSMDALQLELTLTSPAVVEESPFTARNLAGLLTPPMSPRPMSASVSASLSGSEPAAAQAAETGSISSSTGLGRPRRGRSTQRKPGQGSIADVQYRIELVGCGARVRLAPAASSTEASPSSSTTSLPVSVLGELRTFTGASPKIDLACESRRGTLPVTVLGRRGAMLTGMSVTTSTTADVLQGPRRFVPLPVLTLQATLCTPFGTAYPCSFSIRPLDSSANLEPDVLEVQMTNVTVRDLVTFLRWLFVDGRSFTAQFAPAEEAWLHSVPVSLSLSLSLRRASKSVAGTGSLSFTGASAHDVALTANAQGWKLTATTPQLALGELILHSSSRTAPTDSQAAATPVALAWEGAYFAPPPNTTTTAAGRVDPTAVAAKPNVWLRARGEAALVGTGSRTLLAVEVSHLGLFATAHTACFDLTVEELSADTQLRGSVQVSLHQDVFLPLIRDALQRHPMVTSLLAAGLPFRFTPEELSVHCPEATPSRRLVVSLRGVFFGSWFDVLVPADQLHASPRGNTPLCEALAAELVEQCASSLWASYANLVGHSGPASATTPSQPSDATAEQGTFLSLWAPQETDEMKRRLHQSR